MWHVLRCNVDLSFPRGDLCFITAPDAVNCPLAPWQYFLGYTVPPATGLVDTVAVIIVLLDASTLLALLGLIFIKNRKLIRT
jgi:hypothetical protein